MKYTLGQKIRKIRELRGYTQRYIAYKLGMSQERYSYLENHKKSINIETLVKISSLLEVSVEFIKGFEPEKFIISTIVLRASKITSPNSLSIMHPDVIQLMRVLDEADFNISLMKKKLKESLLPFSEDFQKQSLK